MVLREYPRLLARPATPIQPLKIACSFPLTCSGGMFALCCADVNRCGDDDKEPLA
jgi:hypothetical protein